MTTTAGTTVGSTPSPGGPSIPVGLPDPGRRPPPAADAEGSQQHEPPEASEQHDGSAAQNSADLPLQATDAVPRALQIVGSIVAPTTLVTALFIYFGFLYAVAYFRYFGINYTLLELPNQAFLILSANGVPLPLAVLAGAALLSLWLYQVPWADAAGPGRALLRYGLLPVVAVAAVGLLGLVLADALFAVRMFPARLWEARGLSLSIGVVLLVFAAHLRRALAGPGSPGRARPGGAVVLVVARWFCLSVLFGIGLFWAVGSYAMRMGTHEAAGYVAGLRCAPDVVLYSEKSLDLQYAGVWEEPAATPDGAYGFRYPGLKLVPQPGKQYLLLPVDWAPNTRPAILLPRADTLRLEFTTVASTPAGAC
jgi:hypothetical protein